MSNRSLSLCRLRHRSQLRWRSINIHGISERRKMPQRYRSKNTTRLASQTTGVKFIQRWRRDVKAQRATSGRYY